MKYPTKVIDGELHKQCSICLNFNKYPISWFDYTSIDDSEFYECWKLSNLQPLFQIENRSKQDRYEG